MAVGQAGDILQAQQRLDDFEQSKGNLKFRCIGGNGGRASFAKSLREQVRNSYAIKQGDTPLCGPAAFMHYIAGDRPAEYINYVLDLAETGTGRLGGLTVTPSDVCRNASPDAIGEGTDPVDWVALASLRDSSNAIRSMKSAGSEIAGMTFGSDMQAWFAKTGWYANGVVNSASIWSSQSFEHLIGINQRINSHVCLLIRSAIIVSSAVSVADIGINKIGKDVPKSASGFPDHWVVLKGHIRIGLKTPLHRHGLSADARHQALDFRVWSWGRKTLYPINNRIPNITPAKFLPYYYGYVSAQR